MFQHFKKQDPILQYTWMILVTWQTSHPGCPTAAVRLLQPRWGLTTHVGRREWWSHHDRVTWSAHLITGESLRIQQAETKKTKTRGDLGGDVFLLRFLLMFFVVSQNEWPMLFGAWRFLNSSGDDLLDVHSRGNFFLIWYNIGVVDETGWYSGVGHRRLDVGPFQPVTAF